MSRRGKTAAKSMNENHAVTSPAKRSMLDTSWPRGVMSASGKDDYRALQVAKFEPHSLSGRERQAQVTLLQFDAGALPRGLTDDADMLVVQNCE